MVPFARFHYIRYCRIVGPAVDASQGDEPHAHEPTKEASRESLGEHSRLIFIWTWAEILKQGALKGVMAIRSKKILIWGGLERFGILIEKPLY